VKRVAGVVFGMLIGVEATGTDPANWERTISLLVSVQREIEDICRYADEYPAVLPERRNRAASASNPPVDPWGQVLSYRRLGSGYELFSNGPDRLPNTEDDVLPTKVWGACTYVWKSTEWINSDTKAAIDPVDRAGQDLWQLRNLIRIYRLYSKDREFPDSIGAAMASFPWSENHEKCVNSPYSEIDPWGEAYVYRAYQRGIDLYSKGPDRLAGTTDDVTPGMMSDACRKVRCHWMPAGIDRNQAVPAIVETSASSAEKNIKVPTSSRGCGCSYTGAHLRGS